MFYSVVLFTFPSEREQSLFVAKILIPVKGKNQSFPHWHTKFSVTILVLIFIYITISKLNLNITYLIWIPVSVCGHLNYIIGALYTLWSRRHLHVVFMVMSEKLSGKILFPFYRWENRLSKKLKYPLKITWVRNGQSRISLHSHSVPHIALDGCWQGLYWPEVIRSSAAGTPMSLGRSWVPLAPGRIPNVTSGKPIRAYQSLKTWRS